MGAFCKTCSYFHVENTGDFCYERVDQLNYIANDLPGFCIMVTLTLNKVNQAISKHE